LASSAAERRVLGRHPRTPGVVWACYRQPDLRLMPRHRRSPKKTAPGRERLVRFSSVGRRPTSATEPSVLLDFQSGTIGRRTSDRQTCHTTVSKGFGDIFIWSVGPKRSVYPHLTALYL